MSPIVSIIIPCFNSEAYLLETLQSVYSQSYSDWELILVNDGSTDGTRDIIEHHAKQDGRTRACHISNQGVSLARNHGIQVASGTYFQFLDHDDLLPPDSLQNKVSVMDQNGADVAYGDYQRLLPAEAGDFAAGDIVRRDLREFSEDLETAVIQGFWLPPAGLLYRRELVEKIGGFDPAYPIVQDHIFMFEAARRSQHWVKAAGVVAFYREHGRSLSKKDASAFYDELQISARDIDLLWQSEGEVNRVRSMALLKKYFRAATFFYERDRDKFNQIWKYIRHHDPKFVPPSTLPLRLASRLLGYPRAEAVAAIWKRIRRGEGGR